MRVLQTGASEIYLNGILVYSVGKTATSVEDEEVMIDFKYPKPIKLSESSNQLLAVRYSNSAKANVELLKLTDGFYLQIGSL